MKRILSLVLYFILFLAPSVFASDRHLKPSAKDNEVVPKKTLKEDIFSVSSDDVSSADSLNRIAGDIDRGYSDPMQTYDAKEHHGAGPFAHEKAMTSEKNTY